MAGVEAHRSGDPHGPAVHGDFTPLIGPGDVAEQVLLESLSLHKATLESTADGILAVDLSYRVRTFNQKVLEMWGISRQQLESGDREVLLPAVEDVIVDIDLAAGVFHHAKVTLQYVTGGARVTLTLTPNINGTPGVIFTNGKLLFGNQPHELIERMLEVPAPKS